MKVYDFDWENKRVLITGASGFKGGWLSAVLLNLGAKVYGVVRAKYDPYSVFSLLNLNAQMECLEVDILNFSEIQRLIKDIQPHIVFHLAAQSLVGDAERDPFSAFNVNVMATINLLQACKDLQVCEKMLICSTSHVFEITDPEFLEKNKDFTGFKESSALGYSSLYATSKASMELAVKSFYRTFGHVLPSILITRSANVIGIGESNHNRVIPTFINAAIGQEKTIFLQYLNNGIQFIEVSDVISGYLKAISSPMAKCPKVQVYHFSTERYPSTQDPFIRLEGLAQLIVDNVEGAQIYKEGAMAYAPKRSTIQVLNGVFTREKLKWLPQKELSLEIPKLIRWYELIRDLEMGKHEQTALLSKLRLSIQAAIKELTENFALDWQMSKT